MGESLPALALPADYVGPLRCGARQARARLACWVWLYEKEKLSQESIARAFQVSRQAVLQALRRADVTARDPATMVLERYGKTPLSGLDRNRMAKRYEDEGQGIETLMAEFDRSYETIRRGLLRMGVTLRAAGRTLGPSARRHPERAA